MNDAFFHNEPILKHFLKLDFYKFLRNVLNILALFCRPIVRPSQGLGQIQMGEMVENLSDEDFVIIP